MKRHPGFGEIVEGYDIPVLNEREIRASSGILFLAIATSLVLIIAKGDFLLTKYVVTIFLVDFLIRVFLSPAYSPSMIVGRMIVSNQVPEYVGAKTKKICLEHWGGIVCYYVHFPGGYQCLWPRNWSWLPALPGIPVF